MRVDEVASVSALLSARQSRDERSAIAMGDRACRRQIVRTTVADWPGLRATLAVSLGDAWQRSIVGSLSTVYETSLMSSRSSHQPAARAATP
jgi:hypothetical protein